MDLVSAKQDERGVLRYESLIAPSGHSTVRLLFPKDSDRDVHVVRDELLSMGCNSEFGVTKRVIAVDVPPSVPYKKMRVYFVAGETAGRFAYEEACLGNVEDEN